MDSFWQAAAPGLQTAFTLWGSPVTWIEVLACLLSVWMVFCNMRVDPLGWPLAILSSALYGLLFLNFRLYGEASLQLLFIALAGWGWWQWRRGSGGAGQALQVHRLNRRQLGLVLLATLAAWPLLGSLLAASTDSDVPYFDALPTVGSIAGQFLLGRKLIENWPVWVVVNLVSVALFSAKGLWLTVLLYAAFAGLALAGWKTWAGLEGRVRA
jgi:nicotinamide mononucleotide transporter